MSQSLPLSELSIAKPKVGVVLLNLGTPDSTETADVRRYLREFLWDARVIETPRWLWWPILNFAILPSRPKKSGHAYAQIWDREQNDSPLRIITRDQAERLGERLAGDGVVVDFAMRYGNPSTKSVLDRMKDEGCTKILLVPLYPQYSATTTATANDKAFEALMAMRWQPAIRTAAAYFAEPKYVEVLAKSIGEGVAALDFAPDLVITSYHGMPVDYRDKGDPYYYQCHETTRLVREQLGWAEDKMKVTFQSRFGRAQWLEPYTDATLAALPKQGVKKIAILAPAFAADCIETLEEIAMQGRDTFMAAGGENFAYIPCLNATPDGMDMIEAVVRRELGGWI